jgi:hypothetical protein
MRAGVWTANLRRQSFPGRNCVLGRGVLYGLHCPSPRSSPSAPFGSRSTDEAHLRSLSQLRHFAESFSLCADQFKGKIQDGERGRFGPWRNCGCRGRWRRCAVAELESRIRARGTGSAGSRLGYAISADCQPPQSPDNHAQKRRSAMVNSAVSWWSAGAHRSDAAAPRSPLGGRRES